MKSKKSRSCWMLAACLALMLVLTACDDERVLPVNPPAESYTETITLLDNVDANGQNLTAAFTLLDADVIDGFITIACFLMPYDGINQGWNPDLELFETINNEIDSILAENGALDNEIINIELQDTITHEDTLRIAELDSIKQDNLEKITFREAQVDTLDSYLDDRFKLSIQMTGVTEEVYPGGIFLDPANYGYAGETTIVWGQGFYLVPFDSASGWRGKSIRLDLDEFWAADGGWDIDRPYLHAAKPTRGSRYTNQFPIREMLGNMTAGSTHTLHFKFGEPGTHTKVTASLYLVYNEAVRR